MKHLICIVCPKGCRITVDEENDYKVTGNQCERGVEYGKAEVTHPTRTVTTTVKITGGDGKFVPVKTNIPLPKEKIFEAMKVLSTVTVACPIRVGDIIIKGIVGTDVNVVATKTMV